MEELDTLIDALPMAAAVLDADGEVIVANAAWRTMRRPALVLGAAAAALGDAPWEGIVDGDGDRCRLRVRRLGGAGRPRSLALCSPVVDTNPEVHALGERLREAQKRQRAILDSIPDIAWLKDGESRYLVVNDALARAAHSTPEQLEGRSDLDVWRRELAEHYRADDRRVMETRLPTRVEEPFVDLDGRRTWIETIKVPIVNDEGVVIGTAGIARDISDRKDAEIVLRRSHDDLEALVAERTRELESANRALQADIEARVNAEQTQRRLAAILEATTDLVCISDVAGRAQYMNRAGRRLVGIADDEDITARVATDLHAPWAMKMLLEKALPIARREGVWTGESAVRAADGREIPVSQVLLVHRGPDGRVERFSTIVRDMSELKTLQERLMQSQKLEAMGRLAGGVAHDFNNLLTVIQAAIVFARRTLPAAHAAHNELTHISTAAQRAAGLTRQLLSFARKQVVEPTVVNLGELVLGADKILRRLLGEHVELVTLPGADVDLVKVDPGQFEQVIMNLAINGRDAMPEGGTLTIETSTIDLRVGDEPPPGLAGLAPGRWVALRVSDTGTGIPEAVLPHLFEPFFTTKPSGEGTGLGLATVHGIVHQAQGHIRVTTEPAAGTTFHVLLPSVGPSGATTAAVPAPVVLGGHETVLLVEDEPQVRSSGTRTLEGLGYHVLAAGSGDQALALVETHRGPIHLLVSDVVMPHMSGPQLVAELVRHHADLTVLFVSGYAAGVMEDGQLPEGTHFLAKPFTPETLARRVRELLDERAGRAREGVLPFRPARR